MRKLRSVQAIILSLALCLGLGCAAFASGEASGESGAYVASSESAAASSYGYSGSQSSLTAQGSLNLGSEDTTVENAIITGVNGSAIQNSGDGDLVVRDSVVLGVSTAQTEPLTGNPGNLLVAGDVRATLALTQAHSFYIGSTIIATNWAALSTDGAEPVTEDGQSELSLYAYGTYAHTYAGGYGAYSDLFCNLFVYGSEIDAAEIGIISGTYGAVTVGTIADGEANDELAAHLTEADRSARVDKELGSVIAGGRNAIMIHSVNLPPYWEYEGYSEEELPLYSTSVVVTGSTLKTDLSLDGGVSYDGQKQAYIDHTAGSVILIKSTNTDIRLTDSRLIPAEGGTGAVIHTVYNNDTGFMNAVPDGESYPGVSVSMTGMDVTGDVIHEDYQRDMTLTLSGTSLTGAINAYDCDHWNETAAAEGFTDYALDESYDTAHGVSLTLSDGSVWTVTAESSLAGLTIDDTSSIAGSMTVDGVATEPAAGTYTGEIILLPA